MQQRCSKYFARRPPPPPTPPTLDPVDGVNRSKFTCSEHGHVTYQIKENQECTNMVANILLADPLPPHTLGMGSVGQNIF